MCSVWQGLNPATLIAPLATMVAPTASGRARTYRFVHSETAPAKPMHNKGSDETNSEGFSAHPETSRRSAAHVRRHPASSGRLCEALERIPAVVRFAWNGSRSVQNGAATAIGIGCCGGLEV